MRQRSLNVALTGALAALFCLLAATAYTEVKQVEASCVSENNGLKPQPGCGTCVAKPCDSGAMPVTNCGRGAACAVDGGQAGRGAKSKRIESWPQAGMQMQP